MNIDESAPVNTDESAPMNMFTAYKELISHSFAVSDKTQHKDIRKRFNNHYHHQVQTEK